MSDHDHADEVPTWLAQILENPASLAAYEQAKTEMKFEVEGLCKYGCCIEYHDSRTGEYKGGWGPVGCACQEEK